MESKLPDIEEDYKRLLHLHRRIFYLKDPQVNSGKALLPTSACRLPRKNTSSIKIVHEPYKIAICLPPKCGTTNWQKAMNVLEQDSKHISPPSGEEYWKPEEFEKFEDVYNLLRNADINKSGEKRMISDWTKILNARNPFTRLYSAWNDKSRTHRFQNGSILTAGKGLRSILIHFSYRGDLLCLQSQSRWGPFMPIISQGFE